MFDTVNAIGKTVLSRPALNYVAGSLQNPATNSIEEKELAIGDKYMKNYHSEEYDANMSNGEWYKNMLVDPLTFFGDNVIENAGFTIAALVEGAATAGLSSAITAAKTSAALGSLAKNGVRNIKNITKFAKGAELVDEAGTVLKFTDDAAKAGMSMVDETGKAIRYVSNTGGTMERDLLEAARTIRNNQKFARTFGGINAAGSEARIETQQLISEAYKEAYDRVYNDTFAEQLRQEFDRIYSSYNLSPEDKDQLIAKSIKERQDDEYRKMQDHINAAGVLNFAIQMPLLYFTNDVVWGSAYTPNITNANKQVGLIKGLFDKEVAGEIIGELGKQELRSNRIAGKIARSAAKGFVTEGGQEFAQKYVSTSSDVLSKKLYDRDTTYNSLKYDIPTMWVTTNRLGDFAEAFVGGTVRTFFNPDA